MAFYIEDLCNQFEKADDPTISERLNVRPSIFWGADLEL
jgi:hypothetical protein